MASNRLPPTAYKPIAGEAYVPYVTEKGVAQATLKAIVTGAILGLLFGAANTYLGLKAGLTISTSIPVSVLTVVAFRALGAFGARHHILELNMSQTVGSASSSVASGVLFTIPALFLWGLDPAWMRITLLAMAGGLFGILAMIPLRRYLIRQEHGNLPYPEGMACAEVLVAAESGGKQASGVFFGLGLGMFVKWLISGLKLIPGKLSFSLPAKASVAVSVSPALMGVGYILGPRIASIMVGGSALAAFILIPGIYLWGNGLTEPLYPETQKLIAEMSTHDLWHRYIRYIGAGAVATGGIITLIQSIPTMIQSFRIGMQKIGTAREEAVDRTDLDLGWRTIALIVVAILVVLTVTPGVLGEIDSVGVRGIASVLIAIFAFFFVTVSARIVGLVGQTSNPTSGMTIAALIGTSSIFWAFGWTDTAGKATALMVGTAVCVAASIAGDTSQDLKTGFILGATPRLQQLGEMLGVVTSAGVVAYVVRMLHQGVPGGIGGAELPAPQSVLMKLVIDGVIDQNLPWTLIFIGMGIALVAAAFRLPVLAFAVGVYLPLSTMAAVFTGGALRWWLTRGVDEASAERRREQGTLVGAGLVGGEGLIGVGFAVWVVARGGTPIEGLGIDWGPFEMVVAAIALIALIATFSLWTRHKAADEEL